MCESQEVYYYVYRDDNYTNDFYQFKKSVSEKGKKE